MKEFEEMKKAIDEFLKESDKISRYARKTCKDCDYKPICAGECDDTIKEKEEKYIIVDKRFFDNNYISKKEIQKKIEEFLQSLLEEENNVK